MEAIWVDVEEGINSFCNDIFYQFENESDNEELGALDEIFKIIRPSSDKIQQIIEDAMRNTRVLSVLEIREIKEIIVAMRWYIDDKKDFYDATKAENREIYEYPEKITSYLILFENIISRLYKDCNRLENATIKLKNK